MRPNGRSSPAGARRGSLPFGTLKALPASGWGAGRCTG